MQLPSRSPCSQPRWWPASRLSISKTNKPNSSHSKSLALQLTYLTVELLKGYVSFAVVAISRYPWQNPGALPYSDEVLAKQQQELKKVRALQQPCSILKIKPISLLRNEAGSSMACRSDQGCLNSVLFLCSQKWNFLP